MRLIGIVLAVGLAAPAAAEWTLQESQDPFDDQHILTASAAAGELQLEVVCKDPDGKQTFRAYVLTNHVQQPDEPGMVVPEITTKVRFDSGKAQFVTFNATDDMRGMWNGQWIGARLARSLIGARQMTLQLTSQDGASRVVQVDLPESADPVRQVMAACDQKQTGKSYL